MPEVTMASLEETLDFCNKVRAAGGGDPLQALMPGIPQEVNSCLIAKNLNFSCEVTPLCEPSLFGRLEALDREPGRAWGMFVEDQPTLDRIAQALELPIIEGEYRLATYDRKERNVRIILLPDEIGAVAAHFDDIWDEKEMDDPLWPYIVATMREDWERDREAEAEYYATDDDNE